MSTQAVTQEIWRSRSSTLLLPVSLDPITGDTTPRHSCLALQGDMKLQAWEWCFGFVVLICKLNLHFGIVLL